MITDYLVNIDICLQPVWHNNPPEINIGINDNIEKIILSEKQIIHYEFLESSSSTLTVELLNKINEDTVPDKGLDKAVIIESISFFNINDPKFVWLGVYEPTYPEPWATEQRNQGVVLMPQITNQTYLAWNGKWTLTFDIPVFTWIHKVQNLGWIYD